MTRRPRILLYSHDTYGLGHLRRSALIADALVGSPQGANVLIVTGSSAPYVAACPEGCDLLKLPSITKSSAGVYHARTLNQSVRAVIALRGAIIAAAAESFDPDAILVDHAPVGVKGELLPLFDRLAGRAARPRLLLGLREIIDEPERVAEEWQHSGAWDAIDRLYDRVLVYGDPRVLTTAEELGLPARLGGRLAFTGYHGRRLSGEEAPAGGPPLVVVTTGGGGDGQAVLRGFASFLEGSEGPPAFRSLVVTGPLLSRRRQRELAERYRRFDGAVELATYCPDLERRIAGAKAVVSMAGYNTAVEILSAGVPALLVPREHPRREQILRAERLAAASHGIEWATAGDDLPGRIAAFLARAFAAPRTAASSALALDGIARVRDEVLTAARRRVAPSAAFTREGGIPDAG